MSSSADKQVDTPAEGKVGQPQKKRDDGLWVLWGIGLFFALIIVVAILQCLLCPTQPVTSGPVPVTGDVVDLVCDGSAAALTGYANKNGQCQPLAVNTGTGSSTQYICTTLHGTVALDESAPATCNLSPYDRKGCAKSTDLRVGDKCYAPCADTSTVSLVNGVPTCAAP